MDEFKAPWWSFGAHGQTIWGALLRGRRIAYARERWTTPDGDFIDVDWVGSEYAPRLLVLFHGLEGDSQAAYARNLANLALEAGCWRFAVPHFRGCSGEPNRTPRTYHAGDSEEIDWILRRFATRHADVYAVGVSLGGNALLKWLGERGEAAGELVRRAAAVSATFDLAATGEALAKWPGSAYSWFFLSGWPRIRRKTLRKLEVGEFRDEYARRGVTAQAIRTAKTLAQYEGAFTAPVHGFGDRGDYWERASADSLLKDIRVPTLLLNAQNDPFTPADKLPDKATLPEAIEADFQKAGGHAGFPGRNRWLARRVLEFLSAD